MAEVRGKLVFVRSLVAVRADRLIAAAPSPSFVAAA